MSEAFDLNAYLRCDCASVGNQTCDKCVLRAHIATLQNEADGMREALKKAAKRIDSLAHDAFNAGQREAGLLARGWSDEARAALNVSPQERDAQ